MISHIQSCSQSLERTKDQLTGKRSVGRRGELLRWNIKGGVRPGDLRLACAISNLPLPPDVIHLSPNHQTTAQEGSSATPHSPLPGFSYQPSDRPRIAVDQPRHHAVAHLHGALRARRNLPRQHDRRNHDRQLSTSTLTPKNIPALPRLFPSHRNS